VLANTLPVALPSALPSALPPSLLDRIDAVLPQTQCTRCGFPDCRSYARAITSGEADINRCPPGGAEGIQRLAAITGAPALALDTTRGSEGPRALAIIDEAWCIGCTLCIKACPVDCIVGAPKLMHTVLDALCTGCELCLPVCPVDCIVMQPITGQDTGWQAWSAPQASTASERYGFHRLRVVRDKQENDERLAAKAQVKLADLQAASAIDLTVDPLALERKRAVVEAALSRARERRVGGLTPATDPNAKPV
jgi:Na+-translocating ferredoxin:NAD+ oxidoreductase subunit B